MGGGGPPMMRKNKKKKKTWSYMLGQQHDIHIFKAMCVAYPYNEMLLNFVIFAYAAYNLSNKNVDHKMFTRTKSFVSKLVDFFCKWTGGQGYPKLSS